MSEVKKKRHFILAMPTGSNLWVHISICALAIFGTIMIGSASMGIVNGDAQKAMQDAFKTDNQIRIMKMSKEERAAKMEEIRKNRQAKVDAEHASRLQNIQSGNREALQADTALQQRMTEAQNAVEENEFIAGASNNLIAEAVKKGRRAQARHKVRTFAAGAVGAGLEGASSGRETGRRNAEAEHNRNIENRERYVVEDRTRRD